MSNKSTFSRGETNQFRHFNESATSQERKLPSAEEHVKAMRDCNSNCLVDSFQLPNPPSERNAFNVDYSLFPLASAVADCFSAGHAWNLTSFLSAAGTAAATTTTTTTTSTGAWPSLPYAGLAGTNFRTRFNTTSSPLPTFNRFEQLLEQSTRMDFTNERGIHPNDLIPFMATSRELTFKIDALERLQKAIDLIPMTDKIDFLAALQVAPELVLKESNYFQFMRHANFDAKTAANKLVYYWKYRRSLFGERAFRPMDMTGDGALTLEDIENIKSGFIAHAPKDSEGCPVVILDSSRRNTDDPQVRMRGTFYHAQCLSEDSTTQVQGYVILCIVSVYSYDRTAMEAVSMLVNTFPMKVKAWHTFDCIKDRNSLEQGFLLGFMEVFLNPMNKLTTYLYSAEAMEDIVWELATEHGLSIESIPECVGGVWTYDVFQQWLLERIRSENNHFFQSRFYTMVSSEDRRIHASPRPHKRSKWVEEDKTQEGDDDDDDDAKPGAEESPVDSYEGDCVEELLGQFQKLLLHTKIHHEANATNMTLHHARHSSDLLMRFSGDQYDALDKALQAISVHDKVDYLTAIHVAPELVLQESDPFRFLSFHGHDAEKAALAIVRYWKHRHELFGDKAFLPMTLTGNGALNDQDIQIQKCGHLAITGQDQHGSTVLVFDPSRRTTDDRGTRMRVMFYTWQVLFDNPVNQDRGFIGIHIIRAPNYDKVIIEGLPVLLSVFPIKFKALHTYDLMKKVDLFQRGFVQGLIGIIISAYTATATYFHSPHRAEESSCNLESHYGLPRTVIPDCIGGKWRYDRFDEFWNERILLEQARYSTPTNCATTSTTVPSPMQLSNSAVAESRTSTPDESLASGYHDVNDVKLPASILQQVPVKETAMSCRVSNHLLLLDDEARRLPAEETAEYFEAVRNAPPHIWEDECSPELFLRVEEFDARKAAIRLAKYWRCRSLVFKSSKYASLTQTGDEALGRKELLTLGTGFLNLLPNDIHGRPVLYMDPSLLQYGLYQNARLRCIFYMMSLMAENEKSQSDGAILIVRINPQHLAHINAPLLDSLSKALPLRIIAVHLISQENVPVDLIESLEPLNTKVHVHIDQSKDVLCSKLELFGLTKTGLPKFVNGDWGVEKFFQWQELRMRIEWRIPTGSGGREYSVTSNFPAMKSYTLLPEDEAVESKRRMSLLHYRRKQNRIRVALSVLNENHTELQQEHDKLLQENQELEARYAKATAIVSNLEYM